MKKLQELLGTVAFPETPEERDDAESAIRAMLADAFEQGQTSGMRYASRVIAANKIGHPELPGPISGNPYRTAL